MIKTIVVFLLITFTVTEINAESYFMFPQHMLPPVGITYNQTLNVSTFKYFVNALDMQLSLIITLLDLF